MISALTNLVLILVMALAPSVLFSYFYHKPAQIMHYYRGRIFPKKLDVDELVSIHELILSSLLVESGKESSSSSKTTDWIPSLLGRILKSLLLLLLSSGSHHGTFSPFFIIEG